MRWGGATETVVLTTLVAWAVLAGGAGVVVATLRRRRRSRGTDGTTESGAEPGTPRTWCAVVANPTKFTGGQDPRNWLPERCAAAGWDEPRWWHTTPEDPGSGQTRAAVADGAAVVVAYGGDGTVRAVAHALAGQGVPLGLVPAGTGNLLARNLGIPLANPEDCLRIALGTHSRVVDIGRIELDVSGEDAEPARHTFLVMAGLGFDAEVMATVEPRLKQKVGWWAYVVAGTRNLRGPSTRVVIRLDDRPPIVRRVRSVIVGNCGELAGGVRLMPDALIDDGWLDVVIVAPRGVVGWAAVTAAVLTRSQRGHQPVEHFRCRKLRVHAERPLQAQIDGDPGGEARVLRAEVDPRALTVRCPAGHA